MLLQCRSRYENGKAEYIIDLLPALPTSWTEGSVSGLRARGGFEVGIRWAGGKLVGAEVRSLYGKPCTLRYKESAARCDAPAGETFHYDP
ncbi:glycoside hydrolase family 95-like protein [Cohnella sp.]|uniref:glycoside hydrolase family 95-like protein n=2 Tax=unclassified Cohnella TaxID=2636738 RepID=UPI00356792E2